MNKHVSCPPRAIATISGYRRICDQLESENRALRLQNHELRAQIHPGAAPATDLFDDVEDCRVAPGFAEIERLKWARLM